MATENKQETYDLFEYIEENGLLNEGLRICENDEQKEYLKKYTQQVCKLYQPLIDGALKMIESDADRERFTKIIMGIKPQGSGDTNAD